MRRIALAFCALLIFAPSAWAAPKTRPAVWSKQDAADLDRLETYLNSFKTMQGDFVQIGPNGQIDQGTFYLSKPGKMRFEYQPPNPVLVVADGSSVTVTNTRLNTADHYPLFTTPLYFLLSDNIHLKRNERIVGVEHQEGSLIIDARSNDRRSTGNITVVFAEPTLELRQWTIIDAQGLATTVSLRNAQTGVELSPSLFEPKDSKTSTANGG